MICSLAQQTDCDIQKPVSSLRSHFERMSHHHHLGPRTPRSKTPDTLALNRPPPSNSLLGGRSSLDNPRSKVSSIHRNGVESVQNQQGFNETLVACPPYTDRINRHRPISSCAPDLSASNLPAVTVQSPVSPRKPINDIYDHSHSPMQEPRLGKPSHYEKDPVAPPTAPIPNRATKPGSQSWVKNRPKLHTSVSESTAIPSRQCTSL